MNKRWLVVFGILILLCGCEAPAEPETIPATEPEGTVAVTEPTVPSGLYLPGSSLERETGGAVLAFPLESGNTRGIRFWGSDILVFSGNDPTVLTRLSGDDRYISARKELACAISPRDPSVTVAEDGMTYYDRFAGELVFLDTGLEEMDRISIPGHPDAVATDGSWVYYCIDEGLRVLNLETGTDRLLKSMNYADQKLTGIHRGGTVLECRVMDETGTSRILFCDSATGAFCHEAPETLLLQTDADFYTAVHYDGSYPELLSGSMHFGPSVLVAGHHNAQIEPLPERHSVILISSEVESTAAVVDYYNLESGAHPYQITLPPDIRPRCFIAAPGNESVWFLYFDPNRQTDVLCRWNTVQCETADCATYLQSRRSSDNPDIEGLRRCTAYANTLSEKHGIQILIWEAATSGFPDHNLIPEYQVPLIEYQLNQVDETLSRYPEGFWQSVTGEGENGMITVCLVRAIEGKSAGVPSISQLSSWDSKKGFRLVIVPEDHPERQIFRELFPYIESRILCTCTAFDDWENLNPEDFQYGSKNQELAAGEDRAFIDGDAMTSPGKDRARTMASAMIPGQAEAFSSDTMQKKLHILCKGIRKVFPLPSESVFPWEQYLSEPLT